MTSSVDGCPDRRSRSGYRAEGMTACTQCGAVAEGADLDAGVVPLGWMVDRDAARGVTLVCPACARRHARAIEGKLDAAWW